MNKEEFLRRLRQALAGDVPPGVIEENIRYYDSYISGEVRKGQSEETTEGAGEGSYTDADDRSGYGSYERNPYEKNTYERNPYETNRSFHMIDLNKWYWKLLAVVLVFSIISLIITVVGGIFTLLAPLIGPLFLIWMVVWIFRMFNNRR